MAYSFSPQAVELIKNFEGFVAKPYVDPATHAEPITVGYGSTHYCDGRKVTLKDPSIDKTMAAEMLLCYLNKVILPNINKYITASLNQKQIDAIGSLCYNIGDAFFHSSLLGMINANPNDLGIKNKWLQWNHAAGEVNDGLTKRRTIEYNYYKS